MTPRVDREWGSRRTVVSCPINLDAVEGILDSVCIGGIVADGIDRQAHARTAIRASVESAATDVEQVSPLRSPNLGDAQWLCSVGCTRMCDVRDVHLEAFSLLGHKKVCINEILLITKAGPGGRKRTTVTHPRERSACDN